MSSAGPGPGRKRIALVSCTLPDQGARSVHGTHQRLAMFVEACNQIGDLDVLFYVPPGQDVSQDGVEAASALVGERWGITVRVRLCRLRPPTPARTRWAEYGRPALSVLEQPEFRACSGPEQVAAAGRLLAGGPDLVLVHRLRAMFPVLLAGGAKAPVYLDLDDIEHVARARVLRQGPWWMGKPLRYLQLPALVAGEHRAIRRARKAFVCSEEDRRYLRRRLWLHNVRVAPNAVAVPTEQELPASPTVLFLGNFLHGPNVGGADYLIHQIWPRVRQAVPAARLLIAGGGAERIPGYAARPEGVEFLGFVEDLEAVYRVTRVATVPLLSGAGTRIKLIEAAAYGKPVVSTRLGAEGLEFVDGVEVVLRDGPDEFAQACVRLLRDDGQARAIGAAARAAARRLYSRDQIVARLIAELGLPA